MSKHLNGQKRAADGSYHGMDSVPGRIDPGNFVREKFQHVKNSRDRDDERMAKHFERLISGRESNPMKMNGQAGREDSEVKIDSGKSGQAKRNAEKIEFSHREIIGAGK